MTTVNHNPYRKSSTFMAMALLGLVCFGLYFKSLDFEYVLDDTLVITKNNYVKKGFDGISDIMTSESFQGYFGEQKNFLQGARYRPLSLVSFAIEYGLWGLDSKRAHLLNIILYWICCVLLFLVLRNLLSNHQHSSWWLSLAFLSTILFAVHPVHVEAVANVKGRDEILSLIFAIGTLEFCRRYVSNSRIYLLILAVLFYVLGLLAKENVITFLAVIPLALYCFTKVSKNQLIMVTGTLFFGTIGYLAYRIQVIGYLFGEVEIADIMNNPFLGMDFSTKMATINYTLLDYLRLGIFPHPLTHDYYPYHVPVMTWSNLIPWVTSVVYLMLIGAGLYGSFKKKVWGFSILFYLLTLSIVSNIFIGVGTFMNERFLFMPSIGICLFIVYLFRESGIEKKNKLFNYASIGILAVIIMAFAFKSYTRVPVWKNGLSLNQAAIKVSKNSARANSFMSTALFEQARDIPNRQEKLALLKEALPYAKKAVEIMPNYKNANIMYSGIYAEMYKIERDEATILRAFKETMSRRPDVEYLTQFLDYLGPRANDLEGLLNFYYDSCYNILHRQQGRNDWALHFLKMGYSLDQDDPKINFALSSVYTALNMHQEASFHRDKYERINAGNSQ